MKILFFILFSLFQVSVVFSQTYNDFFAQEIFFDRLPSAKTEAMGKILSVNGNPYFVSQSNPANLANLKGISVFYSHSGSRYYMLDNVNFYFGGLSYNFGKLGAVAFNILWLDYGTFNYYNANSWKIKSYRATRKLLTLTYAKNIKNLFNIGLSSNLFIDNLNNIKSYKGSFFELGLSRTFSLEKNNNIKDNFTIGSQLKNIFNQAVNYGSIGDKAYFPSIWRTGISNNFYYFNKIYSKSYLIGFTLAVEYQNVLNYKYRTAYKFGSQLSLLNILFFRLGYYDETENTRYSGSIGDIKKWTYGFGFMLEFNKLLNENIPLKLTFNYANLPQPTYIVNRNNWRNFTVYDIIISYDFN